jgi:hypothetical protein
MEPQDNKRVALQKAISAHEQAGAALADLMAGGSDPRYAAMSARLEQNLADLQSVASTTDPGDLV